MSISATLGRLAGLRRKGSALAALLIIGMILVALGQMFTPGDTLAANAQDAQAAQIGGGLSQNTRDVQADTPFFTPTSPPPPTQPASGKDSHLPVILKQAVPGVQGALNGPAPVATPTVTPVSSN